MRTKDQEGSDSLKEEWEMIVNLIVFWLLMSLFFGSRFAGKATRILIGMLALCWVIRLLAGFGIKLLPILLVIVVISKVVIPFFSTFLRHFQ